MLIKNLLFSEKASSLEKLKQECEEIKTLMPTKDSSEKHRTSNDVDGQEELTSQESSLVCSPVPSPDHNPESKPLLSPKVPGLLLGDLDLLPTKEESQLDLGSGLYISCYVHLVFKHWETFFRFSQCIEFLRALITK